jgi:DHA1 family bicyclomycin/chloramphenicol resistance-like MFS transporter
MTVKSTANSAKQTSQSTNSTAQTPKFSKPYFAFLMLFLGILSALGPLLTDMYLPSLPTMVNDFHTTESLVQLSLTMGMIGLAVGQVFFGPFSQKWGRKPVILISTLLLIVGVFSCIFTTDIYTFLACRLAQGLGGAGGIVLSRSIATDCYSGRQLAKTMAIIGAINGIAPAFSPVIGGVMANATGWQGIFWLLTVIGIAIFLMTLFFKETLPKEQRFTGNILSTFRDYAKVLRIRRFTYLIAAYGLAMGCLFSYISAAPFILQKQFEFSEIAFSILFGANSVLIGIGSGIALKFKTLERALLIGGAGMLVAAILQFVSVFMLNNFYSYEATTALMLLFLGITITSSTSMAMDQGREYTGAAAAIVGAIGFLMGGIVSPIVGCGNIQVTTAITLIVITLLLLLTTVRIYRRSLAAQSI